jgi:hypothetical protein
MGLARYSWGGAAISAMVLLSALFLIAGCGGPQRQSVAAEISAFDPSNGELRTGAAAKSTVRVRNTGEKDRTLWVGYSVRDPGSDWHDAPASPVELASGQESEPLTLSTRPLDTPGYYDARASVWDDRPEEGAKRLASAEKESAFRVVKVRSNFGLSLDDRWHRPSRKLGRGTLEPENVSLEDGRLRIKLPAGSFDGGEIQLRELHGYGLYEARIKVARAPSSITGFFLYRPPDLASEIDIEIFNDSSRRIMFTTYSRGEQTNTEILQLPFDPTENFHDYGFEYAPGSVTFYIDGEPVKTYEDGLPERPMKLYVNSWFPAWLPGNRPDSDRYTYVEWIER